MTARTLAASGIFEVSLLKTTQGTVRGYFDRAETVVTSLSALPDRLKPEGVYVTLNLTASDAISGVTGMLVSNDALTGYVQESFNPVRELWKINAVTGTQKVYVKFIDTAGNISNPIEASIELHLLAPDTIILSGPAGFTPSTSAQMSFTCPEGGCVFSYAFDHDDWSEWNSETVAKRGGLSYGNHYFRVKAAKESNGQEGIQPEEEEDPTPAERTWIVGVQPPGSVVPYGPPIKLWKID